MIESPFTVWQWSLPLPTTASPAGQTTPPPQADPRATERRAYLWIPETCRRVRGVILGLQNMLERPLLESKELRQVARKCSLAIVWIAPGTEGKGTPLGLEFEPRAEAVAVLEQALKRLGELSGYDELAEAPLLPVGHSAATPFVWGLPEALPERVFAALPYKGWFPGRVAPHIPILHVSSEWAEWGSDWGHTWSDRDRASLLQLRAQGDDCLVGELVEVGAGHFQVDPQALRVIALFIEKAAKYCLPPRRLTPEQGWLIAAEALGTPEGKPIAYDQFLGDRRRAYWYLDRALAQAIQDHMAERLKKKPQALTFVQAGKPATHEKGGFVDLRPVFQSDGITFLLEAVFLERSPTKNLFGGGALTHQDTPIQYRVSTGGLEQVGPASFRMALHRGGLARQGPPWEPWVIAFATGDTQHRAADRPGHLWVSLQNQEGTPQTLHFPEPERTKDGFSLRATSSVGLPVQYFTVSGPAYIEGERLRLTPLPPRARRPIRVLVAAFQWGRRGAQPVQTAGPVVRELAL